MDDALATSSASAPGQALADQFAKRFGADGGESRAALVRRDALARFEAVGFPTRKQERFKYTDVRPIAEGSFDLTPPVPDEARRAAAAACIEAAGLRLAGPRLVFVDGHYCPALSELGAGLGLETGPLSDRWERAEGTVRGARDDDGRRDDGRHALATLNTAFMQGGLYVRVPEGMQIEAPVQLVFAGSGAAGLAPQPRVLIELEPHAKLAVVQQFLDAEPETDAHREGQGEPDAPPAWTNLVTEVRQETGSRLALYRFQEHGRERYHTALLDARLGRDAHLTATYVDLGGALVRNDIDVELAEPGAECELDGLILAGAGQHVDDHLCVDHRAAHTRSRAAFRAVIGARGRGVFNGKVIVRQGAQKIDARQTSDNLLLDRNAEIDTKPELEIYADDVKCSHGGTVGELDEEQLFYLRTRGIDEDAARGLLTFAFASRVLERLALPGLREHASRRVAESLPHREWEELA